MAGGVRWTEEDLARHTGVRLPPAGAAAAPKRSKMNNVRTSVDDFVFDSKWLWFSEGISHHIAFTDSAESGNRIPFGIN